MHAHTNVAIVVCGVLGSNTLQERKFSTFNPLKIVRPSYWINIQLPVPFFISIFIVVSTFVVVPRVFVVTHVGISTRQP